MSTPGPRLRMRSKRPAQQADDDSDDVLIVDDDDEPGPSNRPAKSQRASAGHAASRRPASQPFSQPQSQRTQTPFRAGTASQPHVTPAGRRGQAQLEKAEIAQLKQKIQKYQEAANKYASEANFQLTQMELDTLAGRIARYMMFSWLDKPGVPVARTKLSDIVTSDNKNHKHVKKLLALVLPEAQARLIEVSGIEMVELERRRGDGTAAASGGPAYYVLQSALPSGLRQVATGDDVKGGGGQGNSRALTMMLLALINKDGGKMEEEVLWRWLAQVCIAKEGDGVDHPALGRVPDELARLVSTRWLLCHKGQPKAEGGTETIYEIGEAAWAEVTVRELEEVIEAEFQKFLSSGARARTPGSAPRSFEDVITIDDSD